MTPENTTQNSKGNEGGLEATVVSPKGKLFEYAVTIKNSDKVPNLGLYEQFLRREAVKGTLSILKPTDIVNARQTVEATGKTGIEAVQDPSVVAIVAQDTEQQKATIRKTIQAFDLGAFNKNFTQNSPSDEVVATDSKPLADNSYTSVLSRFDERMKEAKSVETATPSVSDNHTIEFTESDTSGYKIIKQGEGTIDPISGTPVYPSSIDIDLSKPEGQVVEGGPDRGGESAEVARQLDGLQASLTGIPSPQGPDARPDYSFRGFKYAGADKVTFIPNKPPTPGQTPKLDDGLDTVEAKATMRGIEDLFPKGQIAQEAADAQAKLAQEAKEAEEKVGAALEALGKQEEEAKKNLEKKGFGSMLAKGLEFFGKEARPGYRLALAVTFAGASVATGGLTSILSKGLSAATFASRQYQKEIALLEKDGKEIDKGMVALKSLGYGVVLALGTSYIISEIASHVNGGAIMNSVSEKYSSVKDSLSGFFKGLFGSVDAATTLPTPDLGAFNSTAPDVLAQGQHIASEYFIQPGDNLTKIISHELLDKMPEAAGTNHENIIQNLLNLAENNPNDKAYASLHKFLNEALQGDDKFRIIQPGDKVDLAAIKELITKPVDLFNGETLLEHARKLAGK